VKVDGREFLRVDGPERLAILRKMGVLYQSGALFSSMSLIENVSLPLEEFTTLPRDAVDAIARTKLRLVGLEGFEDYAPSEISGGMRKRAAWRGLWRSIRASCSSTSPPRASTDHVGGTRQVDRRSRDALGTTMVVVTHELPSIFRRRRPLHRAREARRSDRRARQAGRAARHERGPVRPRVLPTRDPDGGLTHERRSATFRLGCS